MSTWTTCPVCRKPVRLKAALGTLHLCLTDCEQAGRHFEIVERRAGLLWLKKQQYCPSMWGDGVREPLEAKYSQLFHMQPGLAADLCDLIEADLHDQGYAVPDLHEKLVPQIIALVRERVACEIEALPNVVCSLYEPDTNRHYPGGPAWDCDECAEARGANARQQRCAAIARSGGAA